MSLAHLSSSNENILASTTTFQFLQATRSTTSLWQAVDDNEGCKKEDVIAVSGNNVY